MFDAIAAENGAGQDIPATVGNDATTATTQTAADQVPPELTAEKMMSDDIMILVFIFFICYVLLIRPQNRRIKVHKELMKSLQKGNKVLTGGGIIGTIIKFEGEDLVVVEISPGVRVRVTRDSISELVSDKVAGESANDN